MKQKYRQKGIALIMVILMTSIAGILITNIGVKLEIDKRRNTNILNHEQAYQYLLAAESYAIHILNEDLEDDKKNKVKDSLDDIWAQQLSPVPVEGGNFIGQIDDLQSRFNINNIYQGNGVVPEDFAMFKRLLQQRFAANNKIQGLTLDTGIADAVVDWIDDDQDSYSGKGGEDNYYSGLEKPYITPNDYLASTSELMIINGFNYDIYKSIKDFVVALPVATKINVNTASKEVLMAVANLTEDEAKNVEDERGDKGFDSVDDFIKLNVLKGKKLNTNLLSVSSEYFLVTSIANIGVANARLYSIIHRDPNGEFRVLLRTQREI